MGEWVEQVERRAAIVLDQMAAVRALALKFGDDPFDLTEPYREMLCDLYAADMPMARLLDRADLVAWFEGKAVQGDTPPVDTVKYACETLRQQIQQITKAMIGLTAETRPHWSAGLELGLSGLAKGSLIMGVQLQSEPGPGQTLTLLDQTDPVYQAVRQAVRSVAVVAQHLSADAVADSIQEAFPDPAVRDTVLVAAHKLAPSGRRGVDQVTFYSAETQGHRPLPLTPASRKILAQAVAKPLRQSQVLTLEGTVRAIDLDARRFELRGVNGSQTQAVRCLYGKGLERLAHGWLNQRLRVSGHGERGLNGLPRLLLVESVEVQTPDLQPARSPRILRSA